MCTFCNNSGQRIVTEYDNESKNDANFELLIYGNSYLRINSTATVNYANLRRMVELRPESVKINYCPMCGRKL